MSGRLVVASLGTLGLLGLWWRLKLRRKQPHIIIRDMHAVEAKINALVQGGVNQLQVISDFDRTLTRMFVGKAQSASCHGMLENTPELSSNFRELSQSLFGLYHAVEFSARLTREQKIPHMIAWYYQCHEGLAKEHITNDLIKKAVSRSNTKLRDGAKELIARLDDHKVPLLVFSAGIGNVIEHFLDKEIGALAHSDNMHIVSNWLDVDTARFREPLIHMFNKDSTHVCNTPYAASVVSRRNVILLGDCVGDSTMAEGVPHDVVLKIGFLNVNVAASLQEYSEVFDVVLLNDADMSYIHNLLDKILNNKKISQKN